MNSVLEEVYEDTPGIYEGVKKLKDITREKYEYSVCNSEKSQLVKEAMWLRDTVIKLSDILYECKSEIEYLENDNKRLRNMTHSVFEEIKKKSLKYIVEGISTTEQLELFKEIFSKYLK